MRGYTTGLVTSPTVVIPFWLWARRRLATSGVPVDRSAAASVVVLPPLLPGVHALTHRLTRRPRGR